MVVHWALFPERLSDSPKTRSVTAIARAKDNPKEPRPVSAMRPRLAQGSPRSVALDPPAW